MWEQQVDLAALTESRLRDSDVIEGEDANTTKICLEHYRVIHWRNRQNLDMARSGGVLTLAREGIDAEIAP